MKNILIMCFGWIFFSACTTTQVNIYQQLGGRPKIEEVVDNFITEIEFDAVLFTFFKDSNIERFREKLSEHICMLTGGPCKYSGDSMQQVHAGMNITEAEFNHSVDLFINAMTKADIPHSVQNKVLAVIIHTRDKMIYL
ncbi:group I truncated hemoglobin [Paraglaciecola psychrophila]|uniref:Globin n=1 Tax=Paraglaciecola psychrophila 170 TaxID=1129794 RepID=K7AYC0_9ALTE|nr:group 1 truncated hemoglobin [Paraglaciecola psychrophila]AGH42886.1 globin [Paraglaciecola psychrophila 170]GAC40090.1 hemoglobin [Paraglaciecola psychrophila 170]